MGAQPKIYVPGQDQTADKLSELYDKLNGSTLAERTAERDERDPKDPFGFAEEAELVEDYETAKYVTVKLVRFFALLVAEQRLAPRAAMFAAELAALNIFNAQDIPIPAEEIQAARKAAYDYYAKAREALPDVKSDATR